MTKNDLPNKIAVFPLSNAIFFPRTILPLNIFENRYIQLVSDCMKEEKLFVMIQPKVKSDKKPEVYTVGCLGKIIDFNETTDRRFIISLSGIVRFKIKKELNNNKLYREFNVDYSDFIDDLEIKKNKLKNFTESQLFKKIKLFFHKLNYSIEFNELLKLNFDQLINTVCMISPFSVQEKQKLIEIVNTEEKIKILEDIIDFNLLSNQENTTVQ